MRISHRHKFVFISNPKCATETIRLFLDEHSDIKSTHSGPFRHHVQAKVLMKHFYELGWEWGKYFKFGTIRNPWARAVSQFFYHKEQKEFPEWILSESEKLHHLHSNFFFLSKEKEMLMDKIIKVEDLETEMAKVCDVLNIPMKPIGVINSTRHDHYVKYYTKETIQKIEELFQFDIEIGNYKFGQ